MTVCAHAFFVVLSAAQKIAASEWSYLIDREILNCLLESLHGQCDDIHQPDFWTYRLGQYVMSVCHEALCITIFYAYFCFAIFMNA